MIPSAQPMYIHSGTHEYTQKLKERERSFWGRSKFNFFIVHLKRKPKMYSLDMKCENINLFSWFQTGVLCSFSSFIYSSFECFLFFLILLEVLQNVRVSGLLRCVGFLVRKAVWWRTAVNQLLMWCQGKCSSIQRA